MFNQSCSKGRLKDETPSPPPHSLLSSNEQSPTINTDDFSSDLKVFCCNLLDIM